MTRLIPVSLADFCTAAGSAGPMPTDAAAPSDMPTIVTAFFDTGREGWRVSGVEPSRYRRGVDFYVAAFQRLALLKNPMVVFTEPRLADAVLDARRAAGLDAATRVYTIENLFEAAPVATLVQAIAARTTSRFRRFTWAPDLPEYNEPRYVTINALKQVFVATANAFGAIATPTAAWIDFGYCRREDQFDPAEPWRFDCAGRMNLFQVLAFDDTPVFEVVRSGRVWFHGALAVGPLRAWADHADHLDSAFRALLACDLVDDDQTLVLMAWRASPASYRVHPVASGEWLSTLRLYRTGVEPPSVALPRATYRDDVPSWWQEFRIAWKRGHRRLKARARIALGIA